MKNFSVLVFAMVIFLCLCIYYRTGYFEFSITTNKTTFYLKNGDSITTNRYYKDLSGNWILLDKNTVVPNKGWRAASINTN